MVYILLGEGFEEIEAVVPGDILRRGGVETRYAAVGKRRAVSGGRGITVTADMLVSDIRPEKSDVIVVPGGMGGVNSIKADAAAMDMLARGAENGAFLAAICAGPSVLAALGFLDGKRITCFPGSEDLMGSALCDVGESVVVGDGLITARAAGSAIDFGLALLSALEGEKAAGQVREALVY